MKAPNIIISLIATIFGGLVYFYTLDFPQLSGSDPGPAFMPRIYAIIIVVFGISLLVKSIFFTNEEKSPVSKKIILYIILFVSYVFLISIVGVYVSTILFLAIMLWITNVRKPAILISVPVGSVLFIFLFFQQLLNIQIPTGFLF